MELPPGAQAQRGRSARTWDQQKAVAWVGQQILHEAKPVPEHGCGRILHGSEATKPAITLARPPPTPPVATLRRCVCFKLFGVPSQPNAPALLLQQLLVRVGEGRKKISYESLGWRTPRGQSETPQYILDKQRPS